MRRRSQLKEQVHREAGFLRECSDRFVVDGLNGVLQVIAVHLAFGGKHFGH